MEEVQIDCDLGEDRKEPPELEEDVGSQRPRRRLGRSRRRPPPPEHEQEVRRRCPWSSTKRADQPGRRSLMPTWQKSSSSSTAPTIMDQMVGADQPGRRSSGLPPSKPEDRKTSRSRTALPEKPAAVAPEAAMLEIPAPAGLEVRRKEVGTMGPSILATRNEELGKRQWRKRNWTIRTLKMMISVIVVLLLVLVLCCCCCCRFWFVGVGVGVGVGFGVEVLCCVHNFEAASFFVCGQGLPLTPGCVFAWKFRCGSEGFRLCGWVWPGRGWGRLRRLRRLVGVTRGTRQGERAVRICTGSAKPTSHDTQCLRWAKNRFARTYGVNFSHGSRELRWLDRPTRGLNLVVWMGRSHRTQRDVTIPRKKGERTRPGGGPKATVGAVLHLQKPRGNSKGIRQFPEKMRKLL